mmetsp:Transcript_1571/g.3782  ORF Transcript_1571/g.3782 Transcript_1571/m.3782 type:complete len:267 (+) Transcript_1571:231-1031(+)
MGTKATRPSPAARPSHWRPLAPPGQPLCRGRRRWRRRCGYPRSSRSEATAAQRGPSKGRQVAKGRYRRRRRGRGPPAVAASSAEPNPSARLPRPSLALATAAAVWRDRVRRGRRGRSSHPGLNRGQLSLTSRPRRAPPRHAMAATAAARRCRCRRSTRAAHKAALRARWVAVPGRAARRAPGGHRRRRTPSARGTPVLVAAVAVSAHWSVVRKLPAAATVAPRAAARWVGRSRGRLRGSGRCVPRGRTRPCCRATSARAPTRRRSS